MSATGRAKTGGRMSAEERREAVLDAAVTEFATFGLHGTSTEAIARRAGISQPYIFRLFGTKKDLFLATAERVCDRVLASWRDAVEARPADLSVLDALGHAFTALLSNREELLVLQQAFAASKDPEIQEVIRGRFVEMYRYVREVSGADEEETLRFMSYGTFLIVATSIDLMSLINKEDWVRYCFATP